MSDAIDRQMTFDLVEGSAEFEFDVGVHAATRTVHVARAMSGTVKLETWQVANDDTFTGAGGADPVVGRGAPAQPTPVRIASLMPPGDSDDDPVTLVTLSRVAAGSLRLVSWRMPKTLVDQPVGSDPIGVATKP